MHHWQNTRYNYQIINNGKFNDSAEKQLRRVDDCGNDS